MPPFKDVMTDQEIWQMVAYLRTQTANIKGKPTYVPDPDGQVITSEKQTFKMEILARNLETPWGLAFLPDGRLLITERPGRLRIVQDGKLLPIRSRARPRCGRNRTAGCSTSRSIRSTRATAGSISRIPKRCRATSRRLRHRRPRRSPTRRPHRRRRKVADAGAAGRPIRRR